jgi:hypothetical protein
MQPQFMAYHFEDFFLSEKFVGYETVVDADLIQQRSSIMSWG